MLPCGALPHSPNPMPGRAGARPPRSPIGEILRYRIVGPPGFALTDLRVLLQDWVLQRRFKRVPGVVDVTAYGGPTKSCNLVIDLPKLNAFGAIVVGATIPFAFFVAVITMLLRGESANLLSLGSLDFGLLVDATVILVENVYHHLHLHKAQFRTGRLPHPAVAARGLSGVPLIVLRAGGEVSTAIFFSALIIVAACIPLFTMEGIEGRIFGPMAKTYAYAISGALLATFTVAPVLAGALFKDETEEKIMPIVRWLGRAA